MSVVMVLEILAGTHVLKALVWSLSPETKH